MTNIIRPASKKQIIQALVEQLGPDHPLTQDVEHGYLHLTPFHIDIGHGKLAIWSEEDNDFSVNVTVTEEKLNSIQDIIQAIFDKLDKLYNDAV